MIKIQAPFAYFGNKYRYFDFIKQCFEENKKDNFVDLFAGSVSIPINIKENFQDVEVYANVKDRNVETFIAMGSEKAIAVYKEILAIITENGKLSLAEAKKDKAYFAKLKNNYNAIFTNVCPYCQRPKSKEKKMVDNEIHTVASLLFDMNHDSISHNLSYRGLSTTKDDKIRRYYQALEKICITHNWFDENLVFENSFIHLDPPYIETTKSQKNKIIGLQYSALGNGGTEWSRDDNERLVAFVEKNLGKNNTFLLWGTAGNHLESLIQEKLDGSFTHFTKKANIFGHINERTEYAFLIK